MRKIIAAINMTLDGYCDHTSSVADAELHRHYEDLLKSADAILYGRITYQLMEYWPTLLKNPADHAPDEYDFAVTIDRVPKIVFSHTLKTLEWDTARLATRDLPEEIRDLRQKPGKDIFIGSPSLISEATRLKLVDEYQLCIHPVIAGSGLRLFKNITDLIFLKLLKTKTFGSGAVVHYYEPVKR